MGPGGADRILADRIRADRIRADRILLGGSRVVGRIRTGWDLGLERVKVAEPALKGHVEAAWQLGAAGRKGGAAGPPSLVGGWRWSRG